MLALVYSHTTELNGWTEPELLSLLGVQILLGGADPHLHPAEHGEADAGRAAGDARLRVDEARGLAGARQRAELRIWQSVEVFSGLIVLIVGLTRIESSVGVVER